VRRMRRCWRRGRWGSRVGRSTVKRVSRETRGRLKDLPLPTVEKSATLQHGVRKRLTAAACSSGVYWCSILLSDAVAIKDKGRGVDARVKFNLMMNSSMNRLIDQGASAARHPLPLASHLPDQLEVSTLRHLGFLFPSARARWSTSSARRSTSDCCSQMRSPYCRKSGSSRRVRPFVQFRDMH
jgi:hypothetical protein